MTYTDTEIWGLIFAMGIGTFLIRFSFLGLIGDRKLPDWILRHLRYTPVAILPGLVAPLVLWPDATGGDPDPARLAAAAATLTIGYLTKGVVRAMLAGVAVLYVFQMLLG
ncbi:MAG: AzlD domain-containing protein [Pseudomonadota bacterium]